MLAVPPIAGFHAICALDGVVTVLSPLQIVVGAHPPVPIVRRISIQTIAILQLPHKRACITREGDVSLGLLTNVTCTLQAVGLFLGFSQGRKEHAGQDANNGNDHQ